MKPESPELLLEFALEVARQAGATTLNHFQRRLQVEIKADASPVTIADRGAELLARELIAKRYPGDGIIGEELGIERHEARRRWILDPIDGTISFIHGVPLYGVMIAVEEGDEAIVGVLHFPALDETVAAARSAGCFWNGARATVSTRSRLDEALITCTDAREIERRGHGAGWRALCDGAGVVRSWGDCYGHALVATGRAEAMIDPVLARWDAAALKPIVEEAGGVYTDWSGAATQHSDSGISTNSLLAAEVRELLAGRGKPGAGEPPSDS